MRKILITNDDGIDAPGLFRLAEAALKLGEVWIVAPAAERSAASHSITLRDQLDVFSVNYPIKEVRAFTCSGMPADCVRVGSLGVMPYKPDVVLSGINCGYNVASDIQYSATCGAAFEAAFQGYGAIALSEYVNEHQVTDAYLDQILEEVIDTKLGYGQILNINFPECPLSEFAGILRDRTVSHGMYFRDSYVVAKELTGGQRYRIVAEHLTETEPGSDYEALLTNHISIGVVSNVG